MTKPRKPSPKTPGADASAPGSRGDSPRPGLPPQSSVLSELSIDSRKGNRYRILRTSEVDATDEDEKPSR